MTFYSYVHLCENSFSVRLCIYIVSCTVFVINFVFILRIESVHELPVYTVSCVML